MTQQTKKRPGQRTLGNLLRQARLKSGLTLREAAIAVGITAAYLSLLERDACGPPTDDKLERLADALPESHAKLFASAGRVAPQAVNVILQHPVEWTELLEACRNLGPREIEKFKGAMLKGSYVSATTPVRAATDIDVTNLVAQPATHELPESLVLIGKPYSLTGLTGHAVGIRVSPVLEALGTNERSGTPTKAQLKALVDAVKKEEEKVQKSRRSLCEEKSVR
jgi:transcriptional regulator with XRE-family HTH domain